MTSLPVLPFFLQKGKLESLNNQLFEKTGCFAFLCTDMVICATEPKSWQDAFSIIVPGLYSVYHDYGRKFLLILLDKNKTGFQPDGLSVPKEFWPHIQTINKILRPNITHGILYKPERDAFLSKISSYYLTAYYQAKGKTQGKPGQWPDYIENMDEEQWQYIVEKITDDSNTLYNHLLNWSVEWEKRPTELQNLKEQFAQDDYFKDSFDAGLCKPIVIACFIEANKNLRLVDNYMKSSIEVWRNEIVKEFLNGNKPDVLFIKLESIIRAEIIPGNNRSSVSIAQKFNLP